MEFGKDLTRWQGGFEFGSAQGHSDIRQGEVGDSPRSALVVISGELRSLVESLSDLKEIESRQSSRYLATFGLVRIHGIVMTLKLLFSGALIAIYLIHIRQKSIPYKLSS